MYSFIPAFKRNIRMFRYWPYIYANARNGLQGQVINMAKSSRMMTLEEANKHCKNKGGLTSRESMDELMKQIYLAKGTNCVEKRVHVVRSLYYVSYTDCNQKVVEKQRGYSVFKPHVNYLRSAGIHDVVFWLQPNGDGISCWQISPDYTVQGYCPYNHGAVPICANEIKRYLKK